MSDVINPVEVEATIRATANEIASNVRVVSDAEREARRTRVVYDRAFAHAYLLADGPVHEKKYRAELATECDRERMEVADLAYRHAERQAKALDSKLRAFQSVGASIRAMFAGQGSGVGG
jgi:hypothetical protein